MAAKIEYNPVNGLPMIEDGMGNWRVLGVHVPRPSVPIMGASQAMELPEMKNWQEIELASWQPPHNTDQKDTSSCLGHAAEAIMEIAMAQAGVTLPAPLSGCYTYGWVNGGRDGGGIVSDAALSLYQHGCCTERLVPEGMIFLKDFPKEAHDEAALFKPGKILQCHRGTDVFALASLGFPSVIGIMIGANFSDLDDEGVAPLPDTVVGGHALPVKGLYVSKKYGWKIRVQNSWGLWGIKGDCYLQLGHFARVTDAFGILAGKTAPFKPVQVAA